MFVARSKISGWSCLSSSWSWSCICRACQPFCFPILRRIVQLGKHSNEAIRGYAKMWRVLRQPQSHGYAHKLRYLRLRYAQRSVTLRSSLDSRVVRCCWFTVACSYPEHTRLLDPSLRARHDGQKQSQPQCPGGAS